MQGNCYVASEALYHLMGGKAAGWKPMNMRHEDESHWFLRHKSGMIIDQTAFQFETKPDYTKAVGRGFLTLLPSKRARDLMMLIVWQGKK